MSENVEKYRPDEADRWHKERMEPVTIDVRTRWLYSEAEKDGRRGDECVCCPGRHAFSRGAGVVRSDVPARYDSEHDLQSHLHRALMVFGDDRDLVIEVRPR